MERHALFFAPAFHSRRNEEILFPGNDLIFHVNVFSDKFRKRGEMVTVKLAVAVNVLGNQDAAAGNSPESLGELRRLERVSPASFCATHP